MEIKKTEKEINYSLELNKEEMKIFRRFFQFSDTDKQLIKEVDNDGRYNEGSKITEFSDEMHNILDNLKVYEL